MRNVLSVLLFILFLQTPAFCGCVGPIGDDDLVVQYNYALEDYVFTGKVVDIKIKNADEATITFQVLKQFKGSANKQIKVFGLGCLYFKEPCSVTDQFIFVLGQTYLVYAGYSSGKLYASGCDRTRLLAEGENDIQVLDKIITKPDWSFDSKKMTEFEKKYYLDPIIKSILLEKNASK